MANELNFIQVKPPEFQQSPLVTAFNMFMQLKDKKYQREKEKRAEDREEKKMALEERRVAGEEKLREAQAETFKLEKEKYQKENAADESRKKATAVFGQLIAALPDEIEKSPGELAKIAPQLMQQAATQTGADQKWITDTMNVFGKGLEIARAGVENKTFTDQFGTVRNIRTDAYSGAAIGVPQTLIEGAGMVLGTPHGGSVLVKPGEGGAMNKQTLVAGQAPALGGSATALQPGKDAKDFLDDKHKYAQRELDNLVRERDQIDAHIVGFQQKMAEIKAKSVFNLTDEDKSAAQQVPEAIRTLNAQKQVLIRNMNQKKTQLNQLEQARLDAAKGAAINLGAFAHQMEPEGDIAQGGVGQPSSAVAPNLAAALGGNFPVKFGGEGLPGFQPPQAPAFGQVVAGPALALGNPAGVYQAIRPRGGRTGL